MHNIKKYNKEIIGGLIIAVVAFFGGMKYGQGSVTTGGAVGARNFSGMMGARGTRGGGFGNGAAGQIVAIDATSITLEIPGGSGSRIVFYSGTTPVMKSVAGTVSDLKVGETVTVNGTANSDGSVTAQSIQLRPAGFTGAPRN